MKIRLNYEPILLLLSKRRRPFQPRHIAVFEKDLHSASVVYKGRGRIEIRYIETTTVINDYLNWPGVKRVFRLKRVRKVKGLEMVEVLSGIMSLSRQQVNAKN